MNAKAWFRALGFSAVMAWLPCAATAYDPGAATRNAANTEAIKGLLSGAVNPGQPGISVRVSQGGEVLLDKAFGLAELSHRSPVTTKTHFRIGSITKTFTAAAILRLEEQQKLQVGDALVKYLPEFPRGDQITLAQLLNHTSGIASYTDQPSFFESVQLPITNVDLIASFQDEPPVFAPGERWAYNNSGYILLGEIIERLSGKKYEEFLEQEFFSPLRMKQTGVYSATEILADEAYGYSYAEGRYVKALNWDMSRAGAAGAMYSTTEDLETWFRAVFSGKVLSGKSLSAMQKSTIIEQDQLDTKYGFGLFLDRHRGLRRVSHGGGLQGFSSFAAYYPEQDFCVIILHNAMPASPGIEVSSLAMQIAETYLGDQMQSPQDRVVDASVTKETKEKYVGRYDYVTAVMDVTLEGDHLYAQITGQPRHEIFPESPTKYFWKVVDAQVEFVLDSEGKGHAIAAKHSQGLSSFRANRLPDLVSMELAEEVLDRYVGEYDFGPLGALLVTREGKQLSAKLGSQPAIPVYPQSEAEFDYKIIPATLAFRGEGESPAVEAIIQQAGQTFQGKRK